MDRARVFDFLRTEQAKGRSCVLVSVCAVDGSSMRNPGTHMGVAEDGTFEGSLSGGCIENAVVGEALQALKAGRSRIVRFGAGSPYLDIKLPCGGGLDIHFQPLSDTSFVTRCCQAIANRNPFSIQVTGEQIQFVDGYHQTEFTPDENSAVFGHWPEPRVLIVGHGAGVEALAHLAHTLDCCVAVLTSDARILGRLQRSNIQAHLLTKTSDTDLLLSDPWTAIVFLFHDHDWEIELMAHALRQPHFYLGAMGGRGAHAFRSEALTALGVAPDLLDGIHAPIGLFHSSRDPQTLALSALAEIIRTYQTTEFGEARA